MNLPTLIGALVIVAILAGIFIRGRQNRKRGKGGCSCGCESCPGSSLCHPEKK